MGRRIVFAAAALAALVAVLVVIGRRDRSEERDARAETRLPALDERRFSAFTLAEKGSTWRFERDVEGWRITAPEPGPASTGAIETMLGAIRNGVLVRTLPGEGGLQQFGLQPPRLALRFEGANAPDIDVGDVDPTGSGVFVSIAGRAGVLLLRLPEAKPLAEATARALRDRELLRVPRSQIGAITIAREGRETRLVRRGSGWWITAPREFPASDAAVDRLLEILTAASNGEILDGADPADPRLGLKGPGATEIRLGVGDGVRQVAYAPAAPDGSAVAWRDDRTAPMRFADARFSRIPADFAQLAERRLTKVNRYTVSRLAWRAPEGSLDAVREAETTWKDAAGGLLSSQRIIEFLAAALDAPVETWREGAASGKPVAVLEVEAEGGVKERVEYFGSREARVASLPGVVYRLRDERPVFNP